MEKIYLLLADNIDGSSVILIEDEKQKFNATLISSISSDDFPTSAPYQTRETSLKNIISFRDELTLLIDELTITEKESIPV